MKQIKYSRQREALLNLLHSTHSHPDAAWLYEHMKEEFPNISLGTVYRNLNLLAERGDILKITTAGAERYDGNIAAHSHLICTGCDTIIDLDIDIASFLTYVEEQNNIRIDNHCLLFEGLCPECNEE